LSRHWRPGHGSRTVSGYPAGPQHLNGIKSGFIEIWLGSSSKSFIDRSCNRSLAAPSGCLWLPCVLNTNLPVVLAQACLHCPAGRTRRHR
jgi:hypothetical protein